jgi:hypothetical protein
LLSLLLLLLLLLALLLLLFLLLPLLLQLLHVAARTRQIRYKAKVDRIKDD